MGGVLFSMDAAQRIVSTVRAVERSGAEVPSSGWYPYVPDDGTAIKLCKTTAAWAKNTSATLTEYTGKPGSEAPISSGVLVKAWNKFGDVESGKWVIVGQVGTEWYLVAPEPAEPQELDVITGVTLTAAGLTFTKKTIRVIGTKTPDPANVVIATTACP